MTQRYRLPQGGAIERNRVLRFTFDGRVFEGYEGDTLASALLANGVDIVGRSFRFHRPRGLLAAGLEEPNGIVTIGEGAAEQTNLKATEVELRDGLVARSVNAWPSARFDIGTCLAALRPLLTTGFYYKTFKWPKWAWYEPSIRRLAGLGRASTLEDPDRYEVVDASCDVLIVGGGFAGLSAARTAAASGSRVFLVEADRSFGGRLLAADESAQVEGLPGRVWLERTVAALQECANVRLLPRTLATGYYDHNLVTLAEQTGPQEHGGLRQRLWHLRCSRVILATGAIERPLVFENNDRPGVVLASAIGMYLNRYAVLCGTNVVIATDNDSAYAVAESIARKGGRNVTLVDTRMRPDAELTARVMQRGVRVLPGHSVVAAHGWRRVRAVTVAPCDATGAVDKGRSAKLAADLVGMSGGWSPAVHLFSQSGGRLSYDAKLAAFVPSTARQAVTAVGAASGQFDFATSGPERLAWHVRSGKPARQWVDFQNDVTVDDIRAAVAEGYASPEHLKRYTTLGMAIDQGKTANVNALGILADYTGRSLSDVAATTFRPPYSPIRFGVLAGRRRGELFMPLRRLPVHDRHEALGARFANYGGWLRPECYPRDGESFESAVQREAMAARNAAVLFDASPLGKIEVKGPDAARFLSRMYVNNIATLKPGAVRYGLMLSEGGTIIDDGVVACLAPDHYQVGTTSAGAQRIAAWLEEWRQCEWPDLDIVIVPVTTQLGTVTLAGPLARTLLSRLTDLDLSPAAFPHLSVRTGEVEGIAARILRVSYTGELSYEINVPARQVPALWDRLLSLGKDSGVMPLGVEALMLLRAEKGYIHVGADTDATTTPDDVGFGQIARNRREDFIGRRSLSTAEATGPDRWQLVGLEGLDSGRVIPVGAQCVPGNASQPPVRPCGRVTSSYYSPTLQRPIALALLERGRQRMGEEIEIYDLGERYRARVVSPAFYDPEGTRLNA